MTSTEMKTDKGKAMTESDFHTDNSWSPLTPQKPIKSSPTSIYLLDGQVEAELPRFPEQTIPAQNQTQSPIYESPAAPGYGLNHQLPSTLATGIIHHDADNQGVTPLYEPHSVGLNCGLGEGTSSSSSSSKSLRWDLNIRAHEGIDCPSAEWGTGMSFTDLLASRNPASSFLAQNSTSVGGDNSHNIFPGLDSQPETATGYINGTMPKYQDSALKLQTSVTSGGLSEQSELAPDNLQNQNNYLNSRLPAENILVFAPPTPNPKTGEKVNTSAEVSSLTNRNTSIPNLEENSISASSRSIDLCSVLQHATETPQPGNGVPVITGDCIHEDENKEVHGAVQVNKPTGQKPRKKKHRPKVVKESKLGRSQKPRVQKKPVAPSEPPTEKRKYVRKQKENSSTPVPTPPTREGSKSLHQKVPEPSRKSCRRALNFGLDDEPSADNNSPHRSTGNFHSEQLPARTLHGMKIHSDLDRPQRKENSLETETETVQAYAAHEFQMFQDYKSMPDNENPTNLQSIRQLFTRSPNSSTCARSSKKKKARSLKRVNSPTAETANISTEITAAKQCLGWGNDHISVRSERIDIFQGMSFPEIHKKRRTEKNLKPSSASSLLSAPQLNAGALTTNRATPADNREEKTQYGHTWAELASFRKKRSREPTSISNLDTLTGFAGSKEELTPQTKERRKYTRKKNVKASTTLPSCMEALAEATSTKRATKRRTKGRPSAVKSIHSTSDIMNMQSGLVADKHQQSQTNIPGTFLALPWRENMSVDTIADALKQLDINQERSINSNQQHNALIPYHGGRRKEKNAIVLYQTDGTMIASVAAGDQATKRKPRARVDLDNETERVWKLLLQDINSEGINGTDEEKAKWWEEERKIFHGRVDSFIARMRLVQGDRRFSPWKGSVVDSVVGVFLTQNVSDHLSSSAFMSLAAQFPILSENVRTHYKEAVVPLVTDPEECIEELDPTITTIHEIDLLKQNEVFDDKDLHGPTTTVKNGQSKDVDSSHRNQVKANDLRVNSITTETETETATVQEDARATEDISSSQHSVVSSQNSADSPCAPPVKSFGQNLESNSDMENLSGANFNFNNPYTSFMDLIKLAEKPQVVGAQSQTQVQSAYQNYTHTQQKSALLEKREEGKFGSELPSYSERICSCYVLEGEKMVMQSIKDPENGQQDINQGQEYLMRGNLKSLTSSRENVGIIESIASNIRVYNEHQPAQPILDHKKSESKPTSKSTPTRKTNRAGKGKKVQFDWDSLRREAQSNGRTKERSVNTMDSINWEAVRSANVEEVANTIKERGMNNVLAQRIQDFLNRLINHHGSIDLEWLRDVPPDKAKEYLLSIRGLGLKSVECVRLLTLHHLAFPVDTNVGRIAVRLGWVPLQPLPESLQLHLLELYPVLESIQKYLWPRLCKLDQTTLYELHYHMITFGKVFCTKKQPNCNACPLRGECRHFASAFASARLSLPGPEERCIVPTTENKSTQQDFRTPVDPLPIYFPLENQPTETLNEERNFEPIVEVPTSPEPTQTQTEECDIEDSFYDDPDEIPTIKLNIEEFSQTLQTYMQSMELHNGDMSKALVALTTEAASIPTPKLKNVSRLRTEHYVYELPDTHPLLRELPVRELDDPCSYLLAVWTPGETPDSTQPPERKCNLVESGQLCDDETCSYCTSRREASSQIVRATLLIPCRTAMKGSFPLNGTYFQVNEVFADHDSSISPMEVPRELIWNLPRRTVYFGTSIPTIFRGLSTEGIQHCFWRGYVCVRGFDQKTRAPRPLTARLHFPASKLTRSKGKSAQEDE